MDSVFATINDAFEAIPPCERVMPFLPQLWTQYATLMEPYSFRVVMLIAFIPASVIFWSVSFAHLFVDMGFAPKWMKKYKIQPEIQIRADEVWKCIKLVAFNQYVIWTPLIYLLGPVFEANGMYISKELPSLKEFLIDMAGIMILEELGFYYSHRILHHKSIYKQIHKLHHNFVAPISFSALYAHPIEGLVSNFAPVVFGPCIMGAHVFTAMVWYTIALLTTACHHSGYRFPWLRGPLDPMFHDFHHHAFNSNYGVSGFLDRVHGTTKGYDEYLRTHGSPEGNDQRMKAKKKSS